MVSILNIPLLESPPQNLQELSKGTINLLHPNVDLARAPNEILNSPLYQNALISPDGNITALLVFLKQDQKYETLLAGRNKLRNKATYSNLTEAEKAELHLISNQFKEHSRLYNKIRAKNIQEIRQITAEYQNIAKIYLGGVPMIMSDSLDYIKSDIIIFW